MWLLFSKWPQCDIMGLMLERRMASRVEDRCLLGDDADTRAATRAVDNPHKPCTLPGALSDDYFRSICEPGLDNQGWCEGAGRYTDMGYSRYDIYNEVDGAEPYIASHTNLGIGNRSVAALMESPGAAPRMLDNWSVRGLSMDNFERLYFRMVLELGPQTGWSEYVQAWITAAQDLFGRTVISPQEQAVRTAFAAANIWSVEREIQTRTGSSRPEPVHGVPTNARPAAASLLLPDGTERSFIFYRAGAGRSQIQYIWRNEARGGHFAEPPGPYVGPCMLPMTTETMHSPAIVGTQSGLYLLWNDATGADEAGLLRAAFLPTDALSSGTNCDDRWEPYSPGAERLMIGSPSGVEWSPGEIRIDCDVLTDLFPGIFPFRAVGAMGLQIGDCVEIVERIPDFSLRSLPDLDPDFINTLLGLQELRAIPAGFDPRGPVRQLPPTEVVHQIEPLPILQHNPPMQSLLGNMDNRIGQEFNQLFTDNKGASGRNFRMEFMTGDRNPALLSRAAGPPPGIPERIAMIFEFRTVVVAFRTAEGQLYAVELDNETPTAELAALGDETTSDPVLAVGTFPDVSSFDGRRIARAFLYVFYGTGERVGDGDIPTRLSYKVQTSYDLDDGVRADQFSEAHRIDHIQAVNGRRRKVDFAYLRSHQEAVVAGEGRTLHVFVRALQYPDHGRPSAALLTEAPVHRNTIRYAQLKVEDLSGRLTWSSERPVILQHTSLPPTSTAPTQVGAAYVNQRKVLHYYFPNGNGLGVRWMNR